jgi:hypothetical protein
MFALESEEEAKSKVFDDFMSDDPLPANFAKALAGESSLVGIVAETTDSEDSEEVEVSLAPDYDGRKVKGVVGSVIKL